MARKVINPVQFFILIHFHGQDQYFEIPQVCKDKTNAPVHSLFPPHKKTREDSYVPPNPKYLPPDSVISVNQEIRPMGLVPNSMLRIPSYDFDPESSNTSNRDSEMPLIRRANLRHEQGQCFVVGQ